MPLLKQPHCHRYVLACLPAWLCLPAYSVPAPVLPMLLLFCCQPQLPTLLPHTLPFPPASLGCVTQDVYKSLSQPRAFACMLRLRCSPELQLAGHHGRLVADRHVIIFGKGPGWGWGRGGEGGAELPRGAC